MSRSGGRTTPAKPVSHEEVAMVEPVKSHAPMTPWLQRQRTRIEQRLDALRGRAHRLDEHHAREVAVGVGDLADRAQVHDNDEVVGDLRVIAEAEVAALEVALARIESGDYEVCEECGEPIAHARLEIVPHSTHCTVCMRVDGKRNV